VSHLSYVAVLAFVVVGTAWLEVALRTRVYRRWRRLLVAVVPVVVVFSLWDLYAIARGHWTFDPSRVTGIVLPGSLPLDEVLFFIVVPVAAVLTLEAVRAVKRWEVGDEPAGTCEDGVRVRDAEPLAGSAADDDQAPRRPGAGA
jgi:lycopene cyclase domain-containing protein